MRIPRIGSVLPATADKMVVEFVIRRMNAAPKNYLGDSTYRFSNFVTDASDEPQPYVTNNVLRLWNLAIEEYLSKGE